MNGKISFSQLSIEVQNALTYTEVSSALTLLASGLLWVRAGNSLPTHRSQLIALSAIGVAVSISNNDSDFLKCEDIYGLRYLSAGYELHGEPLFLDRLQKCRNLKERVYRIFAHLPTPLANYAIGVLNSPDRLKKLSWPLDDYMPSLSDPLWHAEATYYMYLHNLGRIPRARAIELSSSVRANPRSSLAIMEDSLRLYLEASYAHDN